MRAEIEIDTEDPETIKSVLTPGLESRGNVEYSINAEDALKITVEAGSLGALRGATDTAFRLSSLATKLYYR